MASCGLSLGHFFVSLPLSPSAKSPNGAFSECVRLWLLVISALCLRRSTCILVESRNHDPSYGTHTSLLATLFIWPRRHLEETGQGERLHTFRKRKGEGERVGKAWGQT